MKRLVVFLVLACLMVCPVVLFAQSTATVIDAKGDVLYKANVKADWQKVKIKMSLDKGAEIKTGKDGICTLAFDNEKKNLITIKENTQVRLDSIIPADINLSSGRVFSLVKNIKAGEKFQIRTPAAIAGARGTGWLSSYSSGGASFSCFDNTIFVAGLDASGNQTGQQDLGAGFGILVADGGLLGGANSLGDAENQEWSNYLAYILGLTGGQQGAGNMPSNTETDLQASQEEAQQDRSDALGEQRRQDEESGRQHGGPTGGGNISVGGK